MKIIEVIGFASLTVIALACAIFICFNVLRYILDEVMLRQAKKDLFSKKPQTVYVVTYVDRPGSEPVVTVFDNLSNAAKMRDVVEKNSRVAGDPKYLVTLDIAPVNKKYVTYESSPLTLEMPSHRKEPK